MAFSMIPLPQYQNPSDKTVNTLLTILGASGDIASQFERAKQAELENKLAQSQEERVNKLFPEQLNKLQMENQLYIPKTQADINYKTANTNRLNFQQQNPLYGQAGAAGQIGAAELLRQHPELISDPNAANQIMNALNTNMASKSALADLNNKRAQGYNFNSLPVNHKSYLLSQAAGMGINPDEATNRFNQGESIEQIAKSKGFDPNNMPDPIYPLSVAGQNQLKQRQAALVEMDKLGKDISDWNAPYVSKIHGYSPAQIKDALLGTNKDQQAKFLAARMLAPEQGAIRIKSMQGNVGIEAIRDLTDKSLINGKIFESLVTPDVYKKANELVEKSIYNSVMAANSAVSRAVAQQKSSENNKQSESTNKTRMKYNPETGMLE